MADLADDYGLKEFIAYSNKERTEYDMIDEELALLRNRWPLVVVGYHDFTDHDVDRYLELMADEFEVERSSNSLPGTRIYTNPSF